MYEGFFRGYTKKQWGRDPKDIPASVFRRLPIHFKKDANVFHHKRQGQPRDGYTRLVEKILKHENIDLEIGRRFSRDTEGFSHLFYSGQLDEYFDYAYGRLPYRTLRFEHEVRHGTFQNCGTVNYCDEDIPYTRIVEHKHFWPWESFPDATVVTYEYSHECSGNDRPYYPIHLPGDNSPTREIHRARQTGEADELGRPARNISIHRYGQGNRGSHGCAGNEIPAFFHG